MPEALSCSTRGCRLKIVKTLEDLGSTEKERDDGEEAEAAEDKGL